MVLLDSNVLLDLFTDDQRWFTWSRGALRDVLLRGPAAINPIVYAQISLGFGGPADLDRHLEALGIRRLALPYAAAFRAARAFLRYRRTGGDRRSPLPDFYIGAHAETEGYQLLTRDVARYQSYFPKVALISPS